MNETLEKLKTLAKNQNVQIAAGLIALAAIVYFISKKKTAALSANTETAAPADPIPNSIMPVSPVPYFEAPKGPFANA